MQISPMDNGFARRIDGVNLWEDASDEMIENIRTALKTHGVLVFRRQSISESELADFSARFGELDRIVRTDWAATHPCVIQISNMRNGLGETIGGLDANELDWHTDQSYMANPATGALLHMIEMPSQPVDTLWANLKLAWQSMPESLRDEISGRSGIFQYAKRQATYGEGKLATDISKQTPDVVHPLVITDPVDGTRSLYLDPTTMTGIEGMPDTEAGELIDRLAAHATQDKYIYRHRWHIGDVVMWDNGFLMHRRDAFNPAGNRLLKRTTIRLPASLHTIPASRHVQN